MPLVEQSAQPIVVETISITPAVVSKVPLHRLYSPRSGEHYYTTKEVEVDKAVGKFGYKYENLAAHILPEQAHGSVPLYRVRKGQKHIYTTDGDAAAQAVGQNVVGYVHDAQQIGTSPFFRLCSPTSEDRQFTTSVDERQSLVEVGWVDEGIACYVYM